MFPVLAAVRYFVRCLLLHLSPPFFFQPARPEPTAAELARERAIAARLARASVASRRASAAEASWRGSAAEASRRASAAEATEGAEETEEEAEEAGPEALAAAAAPAEAAPAEAAPVESAGAASGELVFSDTLATPSSERVAERLGDGTSAHAVLLAWLLKRGVWPLVKCRCCLIFKLIFKHIFKLHLAQARRVVFCQVLMRCVRACVARVCARVRACVARVCARVRA